MKPEDRNIQTARRIIAEIDDMNQMLRGREKEDFMASSMMQKAAVMTLLNIGELTKTFSDDFLDATPEMPWQDIRSARNIAAHTYDALDMDDVWETYVSDLPQMRKEMEAFIHKLKSGWDVQKEARRVRDGKK